MRWKGGRRSSNVEDRRGTSVRRSGLRLPGKRGGLLTIAVVIGAMYFGVDPALVNALLGGGGTASRTASTQPTAAENRLADMVSVVLADTEDTWHELFVELGGARYQEPKLVLFSDAVDTACGAGDAAMGPFYCPLDSKVFIDLSFYRALSERHKAPGDFAQAYVIAHEVGHHVQNLMGISNKVHRARSRMNKVDGNALSVLQELQADCFAGIWAHHADKSRQIIEQGDVEEALRAASAIGDDTLQRQARGRIVPESFTHGTSEQRVTWFRTGLKRGSIAACDTFAKSKTL